MKHTKFKLLSVLLLLGLGLTALQAQNTLYLRDKAGGMQTTFMLSDVRSITLPSGNVMINKTDGSSSTFVMTDVRYMSFTDFTTTGIANKDIRSSKFSFYPNPVSDEIHITYESDKTEDLRLVVFDIQGKVLYQEMINSQIGTNTVKFNVSQLKNGLYLCRLSGSNIFETIKFIKN